METQLGTALPGERFRGKVHAIEHHLAHLSSAFHVSPFPEATVVSVDGFGDFASAAWGIGRGTQIEVEGRVYFPHSLGIFYEALTQFIGFPHYGDEYKVMGLAPYGEPRLLEKMRRIVLLQGDGSFRLNLDYFRHHREKIDYEWEGGSPTVAALWTPALEDLLGPARKADEPLAERHQDIACSAQAMYEEAFFHLLASLHARHGVDRIAIAGGCGMNSVANGKVTLRSPFREVYVPAAAGDAGRRDRRGVQRLARPWRAAKIRDGPCVLGAAVAGNEEIRRLLESRAVDIGAAACAIEHIVDQSELCRRTAAVDSGWPGRWLGARPDGMGTAGTWQSIHRLRPTACRHEGYTQP